MYSPSVEAQLRQRIDAELNDVDARSLIVRTGSRADVPEAVGDWWASMWGQTELGQLANLSQAARQDDLVAKVRDFLDDPAITVRREGLVISVGVSPTRQLSLLPV